MEIESVFFELNTFGTVYVVRNLKDGKDYAAKIIHCNGEFNGRNQMLLLRESLILHKLNHPAIIKFIGVNFQTFPKFNSDDSKNQIHPTIITEYMQNGSLKKNLDKERSSSAEGGWSPTKKYIILLGIADAMRYLHSHGIIHRDLKPENILNDSQFYPRICDFGLSRCLPEILNSTQLSMTEAVGTPIYMAPELFSVNNVYDKSVDVYAFGILAYEIATGQEPYEELKKDKLNIIQFAKLVESEGRRPLLQPGLITEKMEILLKRCWDKDKEKRPSFDEIYDELSNDFSYSIEDVEEDEINGYIEKLKGAREKVEINHNKKNVKEYESEPNKAKNKKEVQLLPFFAGISLTALLLALIFLLKASSYNELQSKNSIELKNQISQIKRNNEELKKLNEEANKNNLRLQKEKDKLQKYNEELQKEINKSQKENSELQMNNNKSQKDNEKLRIQVNQSLKINEDLQKAKDELQMHNEELQKEINKSQKENFELQMNNNKTQKDNEELRIQVNQSLKINEDLQKAKDELQMYNEELQKEINKSQKENSELQMNNTKSQNYNEELRIQVNQSQKINEDLQKARDELQMYNEELQKEINKIKKENSELQMNNTKSQKDNEELRIRINQSQTINEKLKKTNEELQKINKEKLKNTNFQQDIGYLNDTIEIFNSAPLMIQKEMISKIIQIDKFQDQKVVHYLNKINDLFLFLYKFNEFRTINCFQIDIENKSLLVQNLNKEYPVTITCNAIYLLYKHNLFESSDFVNIMKQFMHITILIKYPSPLFDKYFHSASTFENKFPNNQIKVAVFITDLEETDFKFHFDNKIKSVRLDSSVKKISGGFFRGSFENCQSLIEVIIPPSINHIGQKAFCSCTKLKYIDLPPSVISIGNYAFQKCSSLQVLLSKLRRCAKQIRAVFN